MSDIRFIQQEYLIELFSKEAIGSFCNNIEILILEILQILKILEIIRF